jgi:predicted site-specific integrase-resolvase
LIFDGVELPSLVPREKAAAILGVDLETIDAWIAQARLDTVRMNGRVRVLTSSIEDRMGEQTPSRPNDESQR